MRRLFQKYFSRHPLYKTYEEACVLVDVRVVVPVFLEEDYMTEMLDSLYASAQACSARIELVLVVNYSVDAVESVKKRQTNLSTALKQLKPKYQDRFSIALIEAYDLPAKHAGAGLARKIGMDYAAHCFVVQGCEKGIMVSLDADCIVKSNYFNEIHRFFNAGDRNACTIAFEHRIDGCSNEQSEAIAQYELHLRYYLQALRYTGHPYAYHTIGSCFAVSAEAYVRAGGMPRKQAGEDFYFLQKVIPIGGFNELNSTCVYPSSRASDRVPFGTGPTVAKLLDNDQEYETYNLQAFVELKALFDMKGEFYKVNDDQYLDLIHNLSGRLRSFLVNTSFDNELMQLNQNCSSEEVFKKRFFEVFDAFKVVKYLNYVHLHFLEKTAVYDAALDYLDLCQHDDVDLDDVHQALIYFREMEKR